MFFFFGGITPRTLVKQTGLACRSCGGPLSEVQIDHVLSLFFMPFWTVSRGKPYLACSRCGWQQGDDHTLRRRRLGPGPGQATSNGVYSGPGLHTRGSIAGRAAAADGPVWQQDEPSAPQLPQQVQDASRMRQQGTPAVCRECGRSVSDPAYLFCPFCGTFLKDS